jgi:hypothetical protein
MGPKRPILRVAFEDRTIIGFFEEGVDQFFERRGVVHEKDRRKENCRLPSIVWKLVPLKNEPK